MRNLGVVLLLAGLLAGFLVSQPNDPTLPDALARMQASDFAGAVKMLESITQRDPKNGRAWRNLGLAYDNLKDPTHAIDAYRHALDVQPEMVAPIYAIGIDYAVAKDADHAFEWLAKAKATRKIDMSQAEQAPELAALKSDPRFAKMLPQPADFENPFVEPVKIIREWDGEAANDQFGWIAREIGDVDGDGVTDFVTSAPTGGAGGVAAGRVYVYSTKSGKLLWKADGHSGDRLGIGIEAAGDTNGDGIPDVIASAPGAGKAYIYSGRDGKLLVTMTAEDVKDGFGRHVSSAGDVNHDGFADVFVGAPGNQKGKGAAYVYSGRDGKLLAKFAGEREGDNFGASVAGFTGKGGTLLVAGAPQGGPNQHGRTYVYKSLGDKPAFTFDAMESGQALGAMFLSIPGDLDGDGVPRRLRVGFFRQRESDGRGPHLRTLGQRWPPSFHADGRDGRRRIRHQSVGCGRRGWRWRAGPHRRGMAVRRAGKCGRPRVSFLRQRRQADQDDYVQDSRRYVRIRFRRHGRYRRRWHGRFSDHVGVERRARVPLGPRVSDQQRDSEEIICARAFRGVRPNSR